MTAQQTTKTTRKRCKCCHTRGVAVEWVRRDQEELNLLTNDSISASLKISNAKRESFSPLESFLFLQWQERKKDKMAGPMPKRTWSISALMSSADQSCTRDSQRKKLYITTDSVPFHLFKGTSLTSSDVRSRMDPSAEATTPSGAEPASGRKRGRPKSSTSPPKNYALDLLTNCITFLFP